MINKKKINGKGIRWVTGSERERERDRVRQRETEKERGGWKGGGGERETRLSMLTVAQQ